MKNYQEFVSIVKERVLEFIPNGSDLEVSVDKTLKNNNIALDGLRIFPKNIKNGATPNIYLNQFYTRVTNGEQLEEVLREIANIYLSNKDNISLSNLNMSSLDDIYLCIINKDFNLEFLKDTPYIEFDNLAIIFKKLVLQDEQEIGSITLKSNIFPSLDKEILYNIALENTRRLFGIKVRTMKEMIIEMATNDFDDIPIELMEKNMIEDTYMPMYVITNDKAINGASTLLFTDIFQNLANKLKSDLFILPSSVHELIVVPVANNDPENLKNMVYDVNRGYVRQEEWLSDNIYIFKRDANKIQML